MDEAPRVIVLGPPWLRTGTGRVIEAQIAYYHARGFRTAFIGVPVHAAHMRADVVWRRHQIAVGDLHADWESVAPTPSRARRLIRLRRYLHYLRGGTEIDWMVSIGTSGELRDDIGEFI